MQMATWETMVAVLVHCCGSMLASVVQIAAPLLNASMPRVHCSCLHEAGPRLVKADLEFVVLQWFAHSP
tara:strand:- start:106 stop:312 length:207 start_codon:yes stop_codon:yes gene_type:complete